MAEILSEAPGRSLLNEWTWTTAFSQEVNKPRESRGKAFPPPVQSRPLKFLLHRPRSQVLSSTSQPQGPDRGWVSAATFCGEVKEKSFSVGL